MSREQNVFLTTALFRKNAHGKLSLGHCNIGCQIIIQGKSSRFSIRSALVTDHTVDICNENETIPLNKQEKNVLESSQ